MRTPGRAVPPWLPAVVAMGSVQLGSALSVGLIDRVGPAGTAWLRLAFGAVVFIVIARSRLRGVRRRDLPALLALGVTTGLVTTCFLAAIERIPLGTAVAIEFLGPLTIAAVLARHRAALVWPGLALAGVLLLTEPWQGGSDPIGVGAAGLAAVGWAAYILLTRRIGGRFEGVQGLALTVPVAAVTAAMLGIPQTWGHLDLPVLAVAAGLSLLLPVLPFALEMLALRRMGPHAFGTLMALEPAIGVVLGALVLGQTLAPQQVGGVVLVVLAGAAAQLRPRRDRTPSVDPAAVGTGPS